MEMMKDDYREDRHEVNRIVKMHLSYNQVRIIHKRMSLELCKNSYEEIWGFYGHDISPLKSGNF